MSSEKFDPYGEALPDDLTAAGGGVPAASEVLARVGQFAFWAFAVVIVFVRIRYFSAGL
jgi:hypothetical protein